ncbi:hypothetical protein MBT42_18425 [Streptomyces sp. MBT42]|uniref:hypothetical protein n=1 Tax=Streptomyces sp. MBT42 TaxID=1488373 RepID=UPI001E61FA75|nr:hypothetical protein [Streptomyces sp. MBT42]MCD2461955.1 hypothetical protein [Streptomyces sp. MBT42]MCD2465533.1 hypothetical protein [Streptomyces sp. MBT42]
MDTPTYEPPAEPDRTPRPNAIIDAPTTLADCADDYAAAAPVRATLDKQQRRAA